MRVMPGGALEQDDAGGNTKFFVGRKLQEHRGAFYLEHPMTDGIIQGWDAMEVLWEVSCIFTLSTFIRFLRYALLSIVDLTRIRLVIHLSLSSSYYFDVRFLLLILGICHG